MKRTGCKMLSFLLACLLLLTPLQSFTAMAQPLTEEELNGLPGIEIVIADLAAPGAALNPEAPSYGEVDEIAAEGQPFSSALRFTTHVEPPGTYLLQYVIPVEAAIEKDDVLLASFYARTISSTHETAEGRLSLVMEKTETWEKSVNETVSVPSEWKRFLIPIKAALTMEEGTPQVTLRLGYKPQVLEVAELKVINYKKLVTIDQLPSTPIYYEGMEDDAPWRDEANARIEQIRKGDLEVQVVDGDGLPVAGADVRVEMKRHAFRFGTAVNSSLLFGNGADSDRYRALLKENFNSVVMENEMKWAWWEADRARTVNMYNWLGENGFDIRGHALLWDGPTRMPADIGGLLGDKAALEKRIRDHFHELAGYFQGRLFDWDVLNEPVLNSMIRSVHGEETMADWFMWAKEADPAAKLFLNETQILGVSAPVIGNLTHLLEVLRQREAPIDGIGIQAHFGSTPASPMAFYDQLTYFAQYAPEIAITEFDFNTPREDIQAKFTHDLLLATFSHPNVTSFTMWGFWDGAHWQSNAPLYRNDWSLKPSGEQWRSLIYDTWWTDQSGVTDAEGRYGTRGFYGDYEVTVDYGGVIQTVRTSLVQGGDNRLIVVLGQPGETESDAFEPLPVPTQTGDITAPVWPYGSVFAVSEASPTSATIVWPTAYDNTGVARYEVYRDGSLAAELPAHVTSYDASELELGRSYSFAIAAVDGSGNRSIASPSIAVASAEGEDATRPGWNKGSYLTVSDLGRNGVSLSWPAAVDNDGAASYRIYLNGQPVGETNERSYRLDGLADYMLYTVCIEAKDWEGNLSQGGPIVTFRTLGAADSTPPVWTNPSVLSVADITADGVTVSWSAAQDARGVTAYRLFKDEMEIVTLPSSVRSYRIGGLSPNTAYGFKVEAADGSGNWSASGPTVEARTAAETDQEAPLWPDTRKLAYSSLADRSLSLSWTAAHDNIAVTAYRVYGNDGVIAELEAAETGFSVTGLEPGETYAFRVEAGDAAGNWTTNGPSVEARTFEGVVRTEHKLFPSDDAFIQAPTTLGGDGTTNNLDYLRYKNAAGLSGSEQNKNTGNNRRAYLKFPLDSLTGSVYEASLNLYVFAVQTPNMDIGMDLYAVGDGWSETAVNWANKPADGERLGSAVVRNQGFWKTFEVADYVTGQATGDGAASFKLQDDSWVDQNVDFYSKEASGANEPFRPYLFVKTEEIPADEESPVWTDGELTLTDVAPHAVRLIWSGAEDDRGINGYVVYRNGNAIAELGADAHSYEASGLSPDTAYTFRVEARDGVRQSDTGPSAALTTPAADTIAPVWPQSASLDITDIGRHSALLTWSPAEDNYGVETYAIYNGSALIATVQGDVLSYRAIGLTAGTEHRFSVAALDAAGNETEGPVRSATTLTADTSEPIWAGGSSLQANGITASALLLEWPEATDDTGVQRYVIYGNGSPIAETAKEVTSYYITGLNEGTLYDLAVVAVDAAGNRSQPLGLNEVRTLDADTITPQWPTGSRVTAERLSDRTVLRWDAAVDNVGIAKYDIYRDGVWMAEVTGDLTEYTVSGAPDEADVYKIEARDPTGNATVFGPATSDPDIPVPRDTTPPGWPAGSTLASEAVTATSVKLVWSEAVDRMGVTGYRVYVNGQLTATTEQTAWLTSGLNGSTTYTFKVEAGDEAGNWSTNGPSLQIATLPVSSGQPSNPGTGAGSGVAESASSPSIEERNGGVQIVFSTGQLKLDGRQASASVDADTLRKAFSKTEAKGGAATGSRISVVLPVTAGASGYRLELPDAFLAEGAPGDRIEVVTPLGSLLLPGRMLQGEVGEAQRDTISIGIASAESVNLAAVRGEIRTAIRLEASTGGRMLSFDSASAEIEVRLPYALTAGERNRADLLNVWRIGSDGTTRLVPSGRYDEASGEIVFLANPLGVFAVSYLQRSFRDLSEVPWASDAVLALAAKGMIDGVSEHAFKPSAAITRADFAKLLVAALGLKADPAGSFADVKEGDYYYEAVGIAHKLGIVNGRGGGLFAPKEKITRQDMFVMLARALSIAGKPLPEATADSADAYLDQDSVADYARRAIAALGEEGLVQGSGGNINPLRHSSRAEAAVMLYRLFYYVYR
ncbi:MULTISPECIES: endo-1,4-beta-xylanase [unclassified Cohnella]|uniref:fibronectin type III domain-containing protein n=1 Tax=unclassified Cohnella TaxID=2636738 RepID=UPI00130467E4|nr:MULTISPECIES: endo-1,4-beta-xylanase [unclassified Cohnella]